MKSFPKWEEYEKQLSDGDKYNRNYENRCGNCHYYIGKKARYCSECGTERGKGKFEPYRNETCTVYGPPVKSKYKCATCGNIWITSGLRGTVSRYCPECGNNAVNRIEHKAMDGLLGYIFKENPYDVNQVPKLFSDDEVLKILSKRRTDGKSYYNDGLTSLLHDLGLDFPEKMVSEEMTELQGEQMNLATRILSLRGDAPGKETCPHCGRVYVASFAYDIVDGQWKVLLPEYHNKAEGQSLIYKRRSVQYGRHEDVPAYLCLNCGNEFGKLEIDKDSERASILKRQLGTSFNAINISGFNTTKK